MKIKSPILKKFKSSEMLVIIKIDLKDHSRRIKNNNLYDFKNNSLSIRKMCLQPVFFLSVQNRYTICNKKIEPKIN